MTNQNQSTNVVSAVPPSEPMRASVYARAASLLISLQIVVGFCVVCLFSVWLTTSSVFAPASVEIALVENDRGNLFSVHSSGDEPELLIENDTPELAEPRIEASLEAVADAVITLADSVDLVFTSLRALPGPTEFRTELRQIGPPQHSEGVPRFERWRVHWEAKSLSEYVQRLDYFKIELAAVGGKPDVDYAFNFSKSLPDTHSGPSKDEKRIYMTWNDKAPITSFDQELLSRAGVDFHGRLVLQFYSAELEDHLAWIELENGKKLGRTNVREFFRTVFGVRPKGDGFEFFVQEQQFRPVSS